MKLKSMLMLTLSAVAVGTGIVDSTNVSAAEKTDQTNTRVEEFLSVHPESKNFIETSIDLYTSSDTATSTSVDAATNELIDNLSQQYKLTTEEYARLSNPPLLKSELATPTYNVAVGAWNTAASVAEEHGFPYTGQFMKHAVVSEADSVKSDVGPSPIAMVDNGLANDMLSCIAFSGTIENLIDGKLNSGVKTGSQTGSFTFNPDTTCVTDLATALHGVTYTVSWQAQASGGVKARIFVSDVYDFSFEFLSKYAPTLGTAVTLANDYAYALQSLHWIKPYVITVTANV